MSEALDVQQVRSLGELGSWPRTIPNSRGPHRERDSNEVGNPRLTSCCCEPGPRHQGHGERYMATAAAAAELGRFHRDMRTWSTAAVEIAVVAIRSEENPFPSLSKKAREVLRKELASPAFPGLFNPGPDYSDLMPRRELCQ